jgi:hemerythrin-like domain-containing protein
MVVDTLPKVVHEHHDVLIPHVNALAEIADKIGTIPNDELQRLVATEHDFIVTRLVPHMQHAESAIYPALERLLQNRHSMTPMRREHGYLRRYTEELGQLKAHVGNFGTQLRLRRVLYRMFALIKTHLAEEEAYIAVLERNLSPAETEEIARGLDHAMAD